MAKLIENGQTDRKGQTNRNNFCFKFCLNGEKWLIWTFQHLAFFRCPFGLNARKWKMVPLISEMASLTNSTKNIKNGTPEFFWHPWKCGNPENWIKLSKWTRGPKWVLVVQKGDVEPFAYGLGKKREHLALIDLSASPKVKIDFV